MREADGTQAFPLGPIQNVSSCKSNHLYVAVFHAKENT